MTWTELLGPVDDLEHAAADLASGNWLGSSVQGMQAGLETLALIDDPFGPLLSAGIGWVIDHLQPFPSWLDDLCGDPDAVRALVIRWQEISNAIDDNAATVARLREEGLSDWGGLTAAAFAGASSASLAAISVCARATSAVAAAVELAGSVVAGVRLFVRDTIADLVAFAVGKAFELLSVVLTGRAVTSICAKVVRTTATVRRFIDDLAESAQRLAQWLTRVREWCLEVHRNIERVTANVPAAVLEGGDFLSH